MFSTNFILAASIIFTLSQAAPIPFHTATSSAIVPRDGYITFGGDGSTAAGWPKQSEWMSFEKAWSVNLPIIKGACEVNGWGTKNSDVETQAIKASIEDEAKASNIPPELILAVMMQESRGCVRAPTTHFGLHNPGLMQSAGDASCESTTPCPSQEITQMIHEGTAGEGLPMTLKGSLEFFEAIGVTDDSKWYKAARRYNAGSQITDTNLGVSSTGCYASDIANRLIQPFTDSSCDDNVVATLQGTVGRVSTGDEDDTREIGLERHQISKDESDSTTEDPKSEDEDAQGGDAGPNGPIVDGAVSHCT